GAEPLVVPVHEPARAVDDVQAVVRLVVSAQAVGRADDDPDPGLAGAAEHPVGGPAQAVPVEAGEGPEVRPPVARQRPPREMRDVGAPALRRAHLLPDVAEVRLDPGAHRELARRDPHHAHSLRMAPWPVMQLTEPPRLQPPTVAVRESWLAAERAHVAETGGAVRPLAPRPAASSRLVAPRPGPPPPWGGPPPLYPCDSRAHFLLP